jgi:UDPglucose 6-dehydrogenase
MNNVKAKYKDQIEFATNMYHATENADALVISTEWSIFRTPDFEKLKHNLNQSVIFDGRNLYDVEDMEKEGFTYISIGRKEA